jgi:hypothetical protein
MSNAIRVTNVSSGASLVSGAVMSAVACNMQELVCTNTGGSTVYCQIFDSATVPADTATPVVVFAVPATSTASYDTAQGLTLGTGFSVCISSTAHTKTVGSAEAVFTALIES